MGDTITMTRSERWRVRLFHLIFLLRRPMTLGVRAVIHNSAENTVFLVRHTYVPGWHLPGGGVELGEPAVDSLVRELREEGNIEITGAPELASVHFNRRVSRRDHVVLYVIRSFRQSAPRKPDHEIAETGFFPINALPDATSPATRRRLDEVFGKAPVSAEW